MKSDEQIRDVVAASVRRHAMDLESWSCTRLWELGEPLVRQDLLRHCPLSGAELPILYVFLDDQNWTLVTTRRIWSRCDGALRSSAAADVAAEGYGNFKGYGDQPVERLTLTLNDGSVQLCPFETGKPSMGPIYAIRTLLQLR